MSAVAAIAASTLLALITLLVPPERQQGEELDAARARYEVIAEAIAAEAPDAMTAVYLVAVFRHESAFDRDVHSGKVRGDDERSWCLGQILVSREPTHRVRGTPYRARDLVGVDLAATRRCAEVAAGVLSRAIEACGVSSPGCVFGRYGGVAEPDKHPGIQARVQTFRRLLWELSQMEE